LHPNAKKSPQPQVSLGSAKGESTVRPAHWCGSPRPSARFLKKSQIDPLCRSAVRCRWDIAEGVLKEPFGFRRRRRFWSTVKRIRTWIRAAGGTKRVFPDWVVHWRSRQSSERVFSRIHKRVVVRAIKGDCHVNKLTEVRAKGPTIEVGHLPRRAGLQVQIAFTPANSFQRQKPCSTGRSQPMH
jgi:hypothetical protein